MTGSDKHSQPQQYCAYACVAHARRVGSVVTMGSVHVACYVPGVCPPDYVFTVHESLGEKTDNICLGTYVQNKASRTEIREIV